MTADDRCGERDDERRQDDPDRIRLPQAHRAPPLVVATAQTDDESCHHHTDEPANDGEDQDVVAVGALGAEKVGEQGLLTSNAQAEPGNQTDQGDPHGDSGDTVGDAHAHSSVINGV